MSIDDEHEPVQADEQQDEHDRFHLDDSSMAAPPLAPPVPKPAHPGRGSASALRNELNDRAFRHARRHALQHDATPNANPSVVFGPDPTGTRHGNFLDSTYRAILADPAWAARLTKAHTAHRRVWPRAQWRWRELDAATSSDALLMNVFCHPGVLEDRALRALLGIEAEVHPEFGYKPRIPLANGRFDRTEIDLRLGSLLVEAKLTESSPGPTRRALLDRYPGFAEAFEPRLEETIPGYQLHRGVLAALAEPGDARFCLLADARRPDLLEAWYAILATVRTGDLRCRLQMLTWQELSRTLPERLRGFLEEKYGIVPW
jgi:hypothetical protein